MERNPFQEFSAARRMTVAQANEAEIDVGLRQYMLKVYNYMASGVALTGVVAALTVQSDTLMQLVFGTPLRWVIFLAPLGACAAERSARQS